MAFQFRVPKAVGREIMVSVEALTLTAHQLDDLDLGSVLNYRAEVTEK